MFQLQCEDFQERVNDFLLRHQSILDILSKSTEANARVIRASTKAVTTCGCLKIRAEKKPLPQNASINDLKELFSSHLEGELCDNCRDVIMDEIGKNIFYLTALCNTLGIGLQEVLEKENNKIMTLGRFNMT